MKLLIKSNPTFFWLWYQLYRKHKGVPISWFSKETGLYFDGYPRSGNTFSLHLIRNLWPNLELVHHFHAVAPIKIALKRKIPTFILIRDPLDAITSNYLKKFALKSKSFNIEMSINAKLLRNLTNDYLYYYKWVAKYKKQIHLVLFGDLIISPELVMQKVNASLDNSFQLETNIINEKVGVLKYNSFGAKDKYGSSLPNEEKEMAKDRLKEVLIHIPEIDKCQSYYQSLASTK